MKNKLSKRLLLMGIFIFAVFCILIYAYISDYYKADESIIKYLENTDNVVITKLDNGYFFDGKGENTAIIFYPGAKVETQSYAPLMRLLSEKGVDVFLLDMPFKIALLGIDSPNTIIGKYDYENYVLMGHSLGGIAATSYLKDNSEKINSIIYLASYPNISLPQNIKMLSIYGSNDGVLSIKKYEESKINWPLKSTEKIIVGGNHANFGKYGIQKKDGIYDLKENEQIDISVEYILEFLDT